MLKHILKNTNKTQKVTQFLMESTQSSTTNAPVPQPIETAPQPPVPPSDQELTEPIIINKAPDSNSNSNQISFDKFEDSLQERVPNQDTSTGTSSNAAQQDPAKNQEQPSEVQDQVQDPAPAPQNEQVQDPQNQEVQDQVQDPAPQDEQVQEDQDPAQAPVHDPRARPTTGQKTRPKRTKSYRDPKVCRLRIQG